MPRTDTTAYPWHSDTVYAAELDPAGTIRRANPAMQALGGDLPLAGERFEMLLAVPQQPAFRELLAEVGAEWAQALFAIGDRHGEGGQDRRLWLRRTDDDTIELIAEPAWEERDRLVSQVLALNDDLIATRRSVARRQRELEVERQRASDAVDRTRRLEAILMAGLAPGEFDDALRSLMQTAEGILPGNRADLLLLDENDQLEPRASVGEAGVGTERGRSPAVRARSAVAQPLLEKIARTGESVLVSDLAASATGLLPPSADTGSLIGVPLRIEGRVVGVLAARGAGADCFSDVDLRLLEVVGERIALAVGHAGLRVREQRLAETLQRSLLPQQLPTVPGFEVAARYDAHTAEVGGDFYDVLALGEGRIGVAIGDVTGKGLRAAAAMGRMRGGLHAYAIEDAPPAQVLGRLGRLAEAGEELATAQYVVIDPDGRAELSSAGHLPPLLIENGEARYLEVEGAQSAALGLRDDTRSSGLFAIAPGGLLILYTDGLVEQQRDVEQGMRDLAAAAQRVHECAPDVVCTRLLEELAPQGRHRDDVALLVVRRLA
ncbi:MAG TPA: GAF domain-containing SpoIIE family protein phosphatase [Solirubrobacteraceae bacterium]|nr:GAF domain-containing SpoIIE family protein phosphatase [Solirubrobacteraceae bacterium]